MRFYRMLESGVGKKIKKVKSFAPSQYLCFYAQSSFGLYLIRVRGGKIVHSIREETLDGNSEIVKYITKHKSLPLYFYLYDTSIHAGLKTIPTLKDAKTFIAMYRKFANVTCSFAYSIAGKGAHAAIDVLSGKLDKTLTHKHVNDAMHHVLACKNKLQLFHILPYCIDDFLRQKHSIPSYYSVAVHILVHEGYGLNIVTLAGGTILCHMEKHDIDNKDEMRRVLQNSISVSSQYAMTHDKQRKPVHNVIISDIPNIADILGEHEDNITLESLDNNNEINEHGIIPYLMLNASKCRPKFKVLSKVIQLRQIIMNGSKFLVFASIGIIVLSAISFTKWFIVEDRVAHNKLNEAKKNYKILQSQYDREIKTIPDLDFYTNLVYISILHNQVETEKDWVLLSSQVSSMIGLIDYLSVNTISSECSEDECFESVDKIPEITLNITIHNLSGYLHDLHSKIDIVRQILETKLGEQYRVSGIQHDDKIDFRQQYFKQDFDIKLRIKNKPVSSSSN